MASPFAVPSILFTPSTDVKNEEEDDTSQSSTGVGTSTGFLSAAVTPSGSTRQSLADEDSRGSSGSLSHSVVKKRKMDAVGGGGGSQSSSVSGNNNNDIGKQSTSSSSIGFSADKIIEYQWPIMSGNYFMLQEQICDFLGIKSFKRKYPDFVRRPCDVEERRYLRDSGLILEEPHMELGMTALRSDDVMELMAKEYPAKYCEYLSVLDTRHQEDYAVNVSKGYSTVSVEKSKMGEFIKKAIKSVTQYNQTLNQERREERSACMDLQTYTTHFPIGLGCENKQLLRNNSKGLVKKPTGKHPVALVAGQFQDWYVKYTSDEMKYLPVNTVLYGPIVTDTSKLPPLLSTPEEDVEDSCDSECESKSEDCEQDSCSSPSNESDSSCCSSSEENNVVGPPPAPLLMRDDKLKSSKPNAKCKQCGLSCMNKQGVLESLVHCADCDNSCHPSCLELTTEMVDVIRSYPWQCTDCKACVTCEKSTDEENMMFCDKCDRGYHTFCVGLQSIPQGKWVCKLCAQCAVCGTTKPGGEVPSSNKATPGKEVKTTKRRSAVAAAKEAAREAAASSSADSWQHESIRIISPTGQTLSRHNLLCQSCYASRRSKPS